MPRPLIAMSLQEFFSNLEIPLLNGPLGELGGFLLAAFFHAFLLFNLFGAMPMFFIWLERKVSGRIQDRLGPTRVGGMFGWLQSIADPIKLIQKEDLTPDAADRWLFKIAPILAVLASFGAFMVLPFADGWYAVAADTGVFLILAILSLEVFGIILAGYSSGSKWALFGAMREAAQMVSYEIPMALCAGAAGDGGDARFSRDRPAAGGGAAPVADLYEPLHVCSVLRLLHDGHGEREAGAVRPG